MKNRLKRRDENREKARKKEQQLEGTTETRVTRNY